MRKSGWEAALFWFIVFRFIDKVSFISWTFQSTLYKKDLR